MKKQENSGFAVLWVVLVIVVLAGGGYYSYSKFMTGTKKSGQSDTEYQPPMNTDAVADRLKGFHPDIKLPPSEAIHELTVGGDFGESFAKGFIVVGVSKEQAQDFYIKDLGGKGWALLSNKTETTTMITGTMTSTIIKFKKDKYDVTITIVVQASQGIMLSISQTPKY